MKPNQIRPGTFKVKYPRGREPFMLSIVQVAGLIGVAPYPVGGKRPGWGRHLLLTESVRDWLMRLSPEP